MSTTSDPGGQAGGGTSVGCPAGIGFCDDFESYPEGSAPYDSATGHWKMVRTSADVKLVVDSMNASSGSKALHISATNLKGGIQTTSGTSIISTKPGDPAFAGNSLTGYVRFMLLLKTFTQSGVTHGRMFRIGDDTIDSLGVGGTPSPTGYALDLHYAVPAHFELEQFNDHYYGDVDPTPLLGQWVCWEYEIGTGKTVHLWKDGTEVSAQVPSKWVTQAVQFTKMTIGFETYTPLTAIDFWVDDVAFDATKRIGCPAAK